VSDFSVSPGISDNTMSPDGSPLYALECWARGVSAGFHVYCQAVWEDLVSDPDGVIIEANKGWATLNLRFEIWVDSEIAQTTLGYAQVLDDESPTKSTWHLTFETENLGRRVESLLTAPHVAALEWLPYLIKARGDRAGLCLASASPSAYFLSSPRERLGCRSSHSKRKSP
jgi:hypothetical protein